jgi:DNA-binding CsgD family transcriptional regulator
MNASVDFGRPHDDPWSAPDFNDRHLEILGLVQDGKSSGDIGTILGLSRRTVEWHLARIFAALGVHTRVQAVVRARELGVISPSQHRPPAPRSFRPQSRRPRRRID